MSRNIDTHLLELKNKTDGKREEAAYQLSKIDDFGDNEKSIVEALRDALEDSSLDVQCLAVKALGISKSSEAFTILIGCLSKPEKEPIVRETAAEILGLIKSEEAVENLVNILKDEQQDWFLRRGCAIALKEIGTSEALEEVRCFLKPIYSTNLILWLNPSYSDKYWQKKEKIVSQVSSRTNEIAKAASAGGSPKSKITKTKKINLGDKFDVDLIISIEFQKLSDKEYLKIFTKVCSNEQQLLPPTFKLIAQDKVGDIIIEEEAKTEQDTLKLKKFLLEIGNEDDDEFKVILSFEDYEFTESFELKEI